MTGAIRCIRATCGKHPNEKDKWGAYEVTRKKDGSIIRKASGGVCGECGEVAVAFEHLGDPEAVLSMCNENAEMEQSFKLAKRFKLNEDAKNFNPSSVSVRTGMQMRGLVCRRGLTPQEFESVFGKTYTDAKTTT